jgi:hypothetical protein
MIVRKTQIPTRNEFKNKSNVYYTQKGYKNKSKKNFQQELFDVINWNNKETEVKTIDLYSENLENEIKKMFLGEIVKKDHLFSGSLSEMQRENIIKISELYY